MSKNAEARARLMALLDEQHSFPMTYTHKIVGKNTDVFRNALHELVKKFTELKIVSEKQTSTGAHVSVTFEMTASGSHAIADLVEMSGEIPDVLFVL